MITITFRPDEPVERVCATCQRCEQKMYMYGHIHRTKRDMTGTMCPNCNAWVTAKGRELVYENARHI